MALDVGSASLYPIAFSLGKGELMSEAEPSGLYVCMVFETRAILGRISHFNSKRVEQTLLAKHYPGPGGEVMEGWQTGSRRDLLATFPDLLSEQVFDEADRAYSINPKHQVEFDREDV